jgi:hypothetical protein
MQKLLPCPRNEGSLCHLPQCHIEYCQVEQNEEHQRTKKVLDKIWIDLLVVAAFGAAVAAIAGYFIVYLLVLMDAALVSFVLASTITVFAIFAWMLVGATLKVYRPHLQWRKYAWEEFFRLAFFVLLPIAVFALLWMIRR